MKKVCKVNDNDLKILKVLLENREGLRGKSIQKLADLKQSVLYKRLNILRDKKLVENNYPLWNLVNGGVKFVESLLKSDKNIFELHHPAYVVKLLEIPKWWNPKGTQMRNKLMLLKDYQFQQVKDFGKNSSNPYIQLKNDRYVIQMYPESVIIIHRKRYYSNNPYTLTIQFLNEFMDLWAWFEERMKFKFFKDGVPQMTLRGHDYNRIDDWLANKVKKEGSKFLVEIGDGRKVWVDLSEPFGKEANTPEMQEVMEKHTKDLIVNKPMLNSELQCVVEETAKQISNVTKNQMIFDANMSSHLEVLENIGKAILELKDEIKSLKKGNNTL